MKTPNHNEKNDTKEAESIKKGLRAESLFRYIEKKECEFKQQRYSLLKSIVAKQRQKIAYESDRWDKKLKLREQKRSKATNLQRVNGVATEPGAEYRSNDNIANEFRSNDNIANEFRSNDNIANKTNWGSSLLSISLKGSLAGSRCNLGSSSLIGSRSYLFEQSPRKLETSSIRNPLILSDLAEQKEPQIVENTVLPLSKPKKIANKKTQKTDDESQVAVTAIFKTNDAFVDFQTKYKKPIDESETVKAEEYVKNPNLESRREQVLRLRNLALKNRERIALYMSGESNYAMGVPTGFKVDPHAITDAIRPPSQRFEEIDEQVNITDDLNTSANKPSTLGAKRGSFIAGKGQLSNNNETDGNAGKKALSLALSHFEKGRRPTIHQNKESIVRDQNSSLELHLPLQHFAPDIPQNIENDQKSTHSSHNNCKNSDISLEEENLLKSLAVMADDRLGLSSNFLQKSMARNSPLIRNTVELNPSKSQKTLISPEKQVTYSSFVEQDSGILQFCGHSGTLESSFIQHLEKPHAPKFWDHINMKSVEDFGTSMETSQARLDNALKCIPNSFNQLCLNIEKDDSRAKLGVFAASISSKKNIKMIQSENSKFKIPKAVKYWKTSSSFDDDIPRFS